MNKKINDVVTDTQILNDRESFRVNSHIRNRFSDVVKEKYGISASLALRLYMQKEIDSSDKQLSLFDKKK